MSWRKRLTEDQEIKFLKQEYRRLYQESPPPFNFEEYIGIDDYKQKLKILVKEKAL